MHEPVDESGASRCSNLRGDSNGAGETATDPALVGDQFYEESCRDFPAPTVTASGFDIVARTNGAALARMKKAAR